MLPSLNGLRAIAILLVIFAHLIVVESVPEFLKTVLRPVANGELGVRLFFSISGFLITWLLLKEKEKYGTVNLKRFYIRRLLRIFPVFYFYIGFVFFVSIITGDRIGTSVYISSLTYLQNFGFWGSHWLLAHSWSLAVEEQFYLLWPFIFRNIKNKWSSIVIISIFVIGSLSRVLHYKYPEYSNYFLSPFLKNIDFLFAGCMLAFFRFNNSAILEKWLLKISGWLLLIGLVIVFVVGYLEFDPKLDIVFLPIAGTIMALYFMLVIQWTTTQSRQDSFGCRLLNLKIVNNIGVLSYSLYVWQQFFLVPPYNSYSNYWWTKFPQNIPLLLFAAIGSYYIIEKPFLRIKNRFR